MTSYHPGAPPVPPPGCPAHGTPLYGPEFTADPGRTYDRLRAQGPVSPVELAPGVEAMLVTGYAEALQVLRGTGTYAKDSRRWRALADGRVSMDNPVVPMMMFRPNALFTDGDEHRRLRGAIADSLARIDPNALRGYVERGADTLIDQFGAIGTADLVSGYAKVLPLMVFNELFGSPPEWGDRMVSGMSEVFDGIGAERANAEVVETLMDLVALKRATPGADVTSWLMAHPAQLTGEEMVHQLFVLLGAGTEPQQSLIANGLRLLLSDDRFAGDLHGGNLPVEDALDEVLWTDPPMANYAVHYPVHDTELAGVRLPEGAPVVISMAAANTDPSLGGDGVRRAGNRAHLAWSAGPHTCPAQSPARLIATVAIERLLDRLPDMEPAVPVQQLTWRPGPFHRALNALPVRFPPISVTVSVPLPAPLPGTPGDSPWTSAPPASSSAPPAATSAESPSASANGGRRRVRSFLAAWWRGR